LTTARGDILTIGAVFALYFASSGIESLRIGLNRAYGLSERRPWWLLRLESIGYVLVAARGGQYFVDFVGNAAGDFARPGPNDQPGHFVGEVLRADKAGNGRNQDQEREHRHQDRQRDVARYRPAVVGIEAEEGVHGHAVAQADRLQRPHLCILSAGQFIHSIAFVHCTHKFIIMGSSLSSSLGSSFGPG
jgi:hypothetical protein